MDKSSFIGIILGVLAIGIGMVLKGVNLSALINPAAIIIILLGTAAAVLIAFPMRTIKKIPLWLKIIFQDKEQKDIKELITMFSSMAEITRREGILTLETKMNEVNDPFLETGIQLAVDGQTPDFIRDIMIEKVEAMERRHEEGAAVFTQAGTYAPTLGVLGAVVGLIAALGNMEDMDKLGAAISAAFIATLFGIFTGYVLWHPFANKLKKKSQEEVFIKEIMIEGIVSITTGDSPQIVKEKLSSYLSTKELALIDQEENDAK